MREKNEILKLSKIKESIDHESMIDNVKLFLPVLLLSTTVTTMLLIFMSEMITNQ